MKRLLMIVVVCQTVAILHAQVGAEVGARHAVVVVENSPFEPSVQLLSELDLALLVLLESWELTAGAGVGFVSPSPLTESGVLYRALVTRSGHLGVRYRFAPALLTGIDLRAVFATYELTSLLFFYPELRAAFSLDFGPIAGAPVVIDLWAGYQFRQDLTFSLSAGGSARVRMAVGP